MSLGKVVPIAGFPVHEATPEDLAIHLLSVLRHHEKISLLFANSNFVVKCKALLNRMVNDSVLIVNDGIGVDIVAKFLHGRPFKAFRRLQPGGATWRGARVYYPSIRQAARAFAPYFQVMRTGALGVLVPPPYTEPWARDHARLVARLDRLERRIETWPFVPWLGDHYLLELVRK